MEMEKIRKALYGMGFSYNEVKVYLVLNDNGSCKAGTVAKLAQIDRSSCYNTLKSLTEKGIVSYALMGKVKVFQVTGPRTLLEYLKEKEENIKEVLPELRKRHSMGVEKGQVRLFKGVKGVKSVFMDMAKIGKDNYVFGSEGQFSKRMPEFAVQFDRLKRENNIRTQMIIKQGETELDRDRTEYRYLPNVSGSPAVTNIYGDKVAIIIWTDDPEGVIIENKAVAKAYKEYFDFMWENAKKIHLGKK